MSTRAKPHAVAYTMSDPLAASTVKNGDPPQLSRIKTGSFERRLSLTRAGLFAGTRMAGSSIANLFTKAETKAEKRRERAGREAHYLADELGKLKGSVVKIGQMMAIYGEHFLSPEVTAALHTLEDRTTALAWPVIEHVLLEELGAERLQELVIEETPIACASLAQVHRARHREDDLEICLKVQYPGVAAAIDSDLAAVAQLLRMAKVVTAGRDFDGWLEEVRHMMHREVDYQMEAATTEHFRSLLAGDDRFIVPRVLSRFSTPRILATTFEPGYGLSADPVQQLPLERRNRLGMAGLELFLLELFRWGEMQTDPNFGNYRIRLAENEQEQDRIVLLDFGAVQEFPDAFLTPLRQMVRATYEQDLDGVLQGGFDLRFMRPHWPREVSEEFARTCMQCLEPLARESNPPAHALNAAGAYRWRQSDLPTRVARQAAHSALNRHFQVPPREFVFLNRKLIGVYTFIAVLGTEYNGQHVLEKYLYPS